MKALKSPVFLILISAGIVGAFLFWVKPMIDRAALSPEEKERRKMLDALRNPVAQTITNKATIAKL